MTTKAIKSTMNTGLMKIGVWNVRGLYGKEKLLQEELKGGKKSKCRYSSDSRNRNWLSLLQRMLQNRIPLKIIPLQTTRKENKWKTEEVLERAVVTVETERIKGSNP